MGCRSESKIHRHEEHGITRSTPHQEGRRRGPHDGNKNQYERRRHRNGSDNEKILTRDPRARRNPERKADKAHTVSNAEIKHNRNGSRLWKDRRRSRPRHGERNRMEQRRTQKSNEKRENHMQHAQHEYGSQLIESLNGIGGGPRRSSRNKANGARRGRLKRDEAQKHRRQSNAHTEQRFSKETIEKMIGITLAAAIAAAATTGIRMREGRQTPKNRRRKKLEDKERKGSSTESVKKQPLYWLWCC